MRNLILFISVFFILQVITSCSQHKSEVIAEKIQYDVSIKSPDPEYDWWIQNLPGPQRDKLVETILNGAINGTFQAYDYFNKPISPDDVSAILSDTTVIRLTQVEPPYESYDSVIVYNIIKEDILRIRFLEEWRMNPSDLSFEKKIVGIAPIARRVVLDMETGSLCFGFIPTRNI